MFTKRGTMFRSLFELTGNVLRVPVNVATEVNITAEATKLVVKLVQEVVDSPKPYLK